MHPAVEALLNRPIDPRLRAEVRDRLRPNEAQLAKAFDLDALADLLARMDTEPRSQLMAFLTTLPPGAAISAKGEGAALLSLVTRKGGGDRKGPLK